MLRTTPLLEAIPQFEVDWLVAPRHAPLLVSSRARLLTQVEQVNPDQPYDLFLSLEESPPLVQALTQRVRAEQVIGAYAARSGRIAYTATSRGWFDMSLVSRLGRKTANRLKFENRATYQDHLFAMLQLSFRGEPYVRLDRTPVALRAEVLLAPQAGPRWPNKRWAFFDELAERLCADHRVTWLKEEATYAHLAETISAHSIVVANDSLPLHVSLSEQVPTIGLFTCTSPWEIHGYNVLRKITSPRLLDHYYSKRADRRATSTIDVHEVATAVTDFLELRRTTNPIAKAWSAQ